MAQIVQHILSPKAVRNYSKPKGLVLNQMYEVSMERKKGSEIYYILKGLDGEFNSVWFEKVACFMAFSHSVPAVGTRFDCHTVKFTNRSPIFFPITTEVIEDVIEIVNGIYKATTRDEIYFIKVVV